MYLFRKPDQTQINVFVESQSQLKFTYPMVGATQNGEHPSGFQVDHHRIQLGSGQATYEAAKQALRDWQHYQFEWIELHRPVGVPAAQQTVGVLAHAFGLWILNACRIVYVMESHEAPHRFAYAYGTLPEHAETGEERFQIEWRDDDSVWYDIFAFSRPNQLVARLAYPYVRRKQKQFAVDSMRAMQTTVRGMVPHS